MSNIILTWKMQGDISFFFFWYFDLPSTWNLLKALEYNFSIYTHTQFLFP